MQHIQAEGEDSLVGCVDLFELEESQLDEKSSCMFAAVDKWVKYA